MKLLSPLEKVTHPLFTEHQLNIFIKRDDLIHPIISGNKWRKLKGNISQAKKVKATGILSFGGAYSNHIHALAYACQQQGLKSLGVIRGEVAYQHNYTLSWARHWGMELKFVDRMTYKRRDESAYLNELAAQYPNYFIVPEGGTNEFALSGLADMMAELNQQIEFDTLMMPVGSGGTISGIIDADNNAHKILGVAVLKESEYLHKRISSLLSQPTKSCSNWQLLSNFHRGGYAKFSIEDAKRIIEFSRITQIPLEPVYSGKMVLALLDLIAQGYFKKGHTIVLLHTGGIQGLGGMAEQQRINATQWPVPSAPPAQ